MTRDERRALFHGILARVCDGPGHMDGALRRAAAEGAPLPAPLDALADTIRARALDVTGEQLAAARRAGHDEDALFEFTVATALGESRRRLAVLLRALGRG